MIAVARVRVQPRCNDNGVLDNNNNSSTNTTIGDNTVRRVAVIVRVATGVAARLGSSDYALQQMLLSPSFSVSFDIHKITPQPQWYPLRSRQSLDSSQRAHSGMQAVPIAMFSPPWQTYPTDHEQKPVFSPLNYLYQIFGHSKGNWRRGTEQMQPSYPLTH